MKIFTNFIMLSSLCLCACDTGSQVKVEPKNNDRIPAVQETSDSSSVKAVVPLGYLLDVNDASNQKLMRVPGMTPEIDKLIKSTRPFIGMAEFDDELDLIGVSEKKRSALYEHLFMVVDVNNAAAEEFGFVPGLSKSLGNVIQAGRPYKNKEALEETIEASGESNDVGTLVPYFKVVPPKR